MTRPVKLLAPQPLPPLISEEKRSCIRTVADRLMPDRGLLPSVDAADTAGQYLDIALVARPDLVDRFFAAVDRCDVDDIDTALSQLRQENGKHWEVLTTILPAAYLMNEDVRASLGYAGQTPDPIEFSGYPEEIALTEAVIARGSIYRPTPANH